MCIRDRIIVADLSREGECYQFFENIADEPVDVKISLHPILEKALANSIPIPELEMCIRDRYKFKSVR